MASTKMLHIRVDDDIKTQANEAFEAMGLSMSEAIRLFLYRVVAEQALPFEMKVPSARTRDAMNEADQIVSKRRARFASSDSLFADLEKNTKK